MCYNSCEALRGFFRRAWKIRQIYIHSFMTKFPSENIAKKIMKDSCSYVNDIVKESIPSGLHSVGFN